MQGEERLAPYAPGAPVWEDRPLCPDVPGRAGISLVPRASKSDSKSVPGTSAALSYQQETSVESQAWILTHSLAAAQLPLGLISEAPW